MLRDSNNSKTFPDNLARWKEIIYLALGHLLSKYQQTLNRYERRHNNIVQYFCSTATSQGMEAYTDLEGSKVNGVTIPANITCQQSPHWLFIDDNNKAVHSLDLLISNIGSN